MQETLFDNLRFTAITEDLPLIGKIVIEHSRMRASRVLELGCGIGETLVQIAKSSPNSIFHGIDISSININFANHNISHNDTGNIFFHLGDYLNFKTQPFNIIYAESVLHLITAPSNALFSKLSNDLKPNGLLIATMPDDCLYNRILFLYRHILKKLRCKLLDITILKVAQLLYPKISLNSLKDRIPYMYLVPYRLDTTALREILKKQYKLSVISSIRCNSTSIAKPKHNLIIFQKIEETALK